MMLVSDTTVRTVVYALQNGDSPDLPCPYRDDLFRPEKVEVQIRDGLLDSVKVDGPVLTKTGKPNTQMRNRDWTWSAVRFDSSRYPWPPEDAPDIAVRVVADLLAETEGQP